MTLEQLVYQEILDNPSIGKRDDDDIVVLDD